MRGLEDLKRFERLAVKHGYQVLLHRGALALVGPRPHRADVILAWEAASAELTQLVRMEWALDRLGAVCGAPVRPANTPRTPYVMTYAEYLARREVLELHG